MKRQMQNKTQLQPPSETTPYAVTERTWYLVRSDCVGDTVEIHQLPTIQDRLQPDPRDIHLRQRLDHRE
jgi:hypothetical protein